MRMKTADGLDISVPIPDTAEVLANIEKRRIS